MGDISLVVDRKSYAVQVLGVDESTHVQGTVGGASLRVVLPSSAEIVEVNLNGPAHVQFGDVTVVAAATDRFLPGGSYYYRVRDYTHLAFIQDSTATATVISVTKAL